MSVGLTWIIFTGLFEFTYYTTVIPDFDDEVLKNSLDQLNQEVYGEIVYSCMIIRNGDRYPLNTFPTNSYSEQLIEEGLGLLTQEGKMRAYNLGRWARHRYDLLIGGEPYDISLLQIISSMYDRNISTAQLFLAGFYPPNVPMKEVWNENIRWQPISILTHPRLYDRILMPNEYCARYILEVKRLLNSPKITQFFERNRELFAYVREHAELPGPEDNIPQTIFQIIEVYDCLRFMDEIGLTLPDWAEDIYPDRLRELLSFNQMVLNKQILRLKGGPLLAHIMKQFQRKQADPQLRKLFQFYVGHDKTIMLLLMTLGVFDNKPISFCASVIIELRLLEDEYVVTVSYKNGEKVAPKLLELKFCPNPCRLSTFLESTKKLVPRDWNKECNTLEPNYNTIFF